MKYLSQICLMALMFGASHGQAADTKRGALISDYVITKDMLDGNCEKDPVALNLAENEADFQATLCRFHKNFRERDPLTLDRNVETLQRLQKQGMSAAQQALAALVEGLNHCQRARVAMGVLKTDATARGQFCISRDAAAASLSSVPWRYARFGYQAESGHDVDELVDEMAACYDETQGPLNGSWNSTCGLIDAPPLERQKQIVDQTYAAVESRYFGGASPITAMFMEKKQLADKVLVSAEAKAKDLKAESDQLLAALNSGRNVFYAQIKNPNNPNSPLDIVVRNYKESYALSKAILARYQEWQKGLLVQKNADGTEEDLALALIGPPEATSYKGRLKGRVTASAGDKGLAGGIQELTHRLDVLQSNRATYETSAKKMCGMLFCYLAVGNETDTLYRRACAGPLLFSQTKNPLCENTKTKLKAGDLTQSAQEFCTSYGFDTNKYGKFGLSADQVSACKISN